MTVQQITLLDDVGSTVVKEIVRQLNRASSDTTVLLAENVLGAGGIAFGDKVIPNADSASGILFRADEDLYVTSIRMMTLTTQLDDTGTPADTSLVLLNVPDPYIDGDGTTSSDQIARPTLGIHGNQAAVALGAAGTYEMVLATDGTYFTDANGFDIGQWGDLLGVTATGAVAASEYAATLISQDHDATTAIDSPDAIRMAAGSTLLWGLNNVTGGNVSLMFSITYRPVTDGLTLSGGDPGADAIGRFSTRDR